MLSKYLTDFKLFSKSQDRTARLMANRKKSKNDGRSGRLRIESLEPRLVLAAQLVITEVHFKPADAPADDFEFIEIKNIGDVTANLENMIFDQGVDFTFPAMSLAPDQLLVIVSDQTAFISRYGAGPTIAGEFSGKLKDVGEEIQLREFANGPKLIEFIYNDTWFDVANDHGFSLVIRDENDLSANLNKKKSWTPSSIIGGSPGVDDTGAYPGALVINEVLAHSDFFPNDRIEIYNTSNRTLSLNGWFLSDKLNNLTKFPIPNGITISPDEYHVFNQDGVGGFGGSFALSELGNTFSPPEGVYLTAPTTPGTLTVHHNQGFELEASDQETPFIRYQNSDGNIDYVAESGKSFGFENNSPLVGPIVISEIMYNPTGSDRELEYVELFNNSATSVNLFDPLNPGNRWKFSSGISFTFPANVTVPAFGYVLVVSTDDVGSFNATTYAQTHSISLSPQFIFPYAFTSNLNSLANNSDILTLQRPGNPETEPEFGGFVPYYTVDRVAYEDRNSWPTEADNGSALLRISTSEYGNDPDNWTFTGQGGSPGELGEITAPLVTSVSVSGTQWEADDYLLPVGVGLQTKNLPFNNINQIIITFSEAVDIDSDAITIEGINIADYGATLQGDGMAVTEATWVLNQNIGPEIVSLDLVNEKVHDLSGNELDGDWTDDESVFPSGDGKRGDDFEFKFHVLPGDVNQDGIADSLDLQDTISHMFSVQGNPRYDFFRDINADNLIGLHDLLASRNSVGSSLPQSAPSPVGAAAALIVTISADQETSQTTTRPTPQPTNTISKMAAKEVTATEITTGEQPLRSKHQANPQRRSHLQRQLDPTAVEQILEVDSLNSNLELKHLVHARRTANRALRNRSISDHSISADLLNDHLI